MEAEAGSMESGEPGGESLDPARKETTSPILVARPQLEGVGTTGGRTRERTSWLSIAMVVSLIGLCISFSSFAVSYLNYHLQDTKANSEVTDLLLDAWSSFGSAPNEISVLPRYQDIGAQKLEETRQKFEKVLIRDPRNVMARRGLGHYYVILGRYDDAVTAYEKALQFDKKNLLTRVGLADALSKTGQLGRARNTLLAVLDDDPQNMAALTNLATVSAALGNMEESENLFERALHLDPQNPVLLFDRGFSFELNGRFDKAVPMYRRALEFNPRYTEAKLHLGAGLLQTGATEEARATFESASVDDPANPILHDCLARTYEKLGRVDEAKAQKAGVTSVEAITLCAPPEELRDRKALRDVDATLSDLERGATTILKINNRLAAASSPPSSSLVNGVMAARKQFFIVAALLENFSDGLEKALSYDGQSHRERRLQFLQLQALPRREDRQTLGVGAVKIALPEIRSRTADILKTIEQLAVVAQPLTASKGDQGSVDGQRLLPLTAAYSGMVKWQELAIDGSQQRVNGYEGERTPFHNADGKPYDYDKVRALQNFAQIAGGIHMGASANVRVLKPKEAAVLYYDPASSSIVLETYERNLKIATADPRELKALYGFVRAGENVAVSVGWSGGAGDPIRSGEQKIFLSPYFVDTIVGQNLILADLLPFRLDEPKLLNGAKNPCFVECSGAFARYYAEIILPIGDVLRSTLKETDEALAELALSTGFPAPEFVRASTVQKMLTLVHEFDIQQRKQPGWWTEFRQVFNPSSLASYNEPKRAGLAGMRVLLEGCLSQYVCNLDLLRLWQSFELRDAEQTGEDRSSRIQRIFVTLLAESHPLLGVLLDETTAVSAVGEMISVSGTMAYKYLAPRMLVEDGNLVIVDGDGGVTTLLKLSAITTRAIPSIAAKYPPMAQIARYAQIAAVLRWCIQNSDWIALDMSAIAMAIGAGAAGASLVPVKEFGGRIDLVVVLAVREDRQLVQILGEPRGRVWQVDETVLDHPGLRVHSHDLVGLRLVAGHHVEALSDELLDQLGPRDLVLDQHDRGPEPFVLRAHVALQLGVFHAPAHQVDQIEVIAGNAPGRADAEIAKLGRLVGNVPALHDAVEMLRHSTRRVVLEPGRLDQAAAQGRAWLLVLAGDPGNGRILTPCYSGAGMTLMSFPPANSTLHDADLTASSNDNPSRSKSRNSVPLTTATNASSHPASKSASS